MQLRSRVQAYANLVFTQAVVLACSDGSLSSEMVSQNGGGSLNPIKKNNAQFTNWPRLFLKMSIAKPTLFWRGETDPLVLLLVDMPLHLTRVSENLCPDSSLLCL